MELDAFDCIARAYGKRPVALATIRPEVVGLVLLLLVNRNTDPKRLLRRWERDGSAGSPGPIDLAVCLPAEAFTTALGYEINPAWRGGGMAGLRALLGKALHPTTLPTGATADLWVDENHAVHAVESWQAAPGRGDVIGDRFGSAFDALVTAYRPSRYRPGTPYPVGTLASHCGAFERPADTRAVRDYLTGERGPLPARLARL